jgi:hypothetical protein
VLSSRLLQQTSLRASSLALVSCAAPASTPDDFGRLHVSFLRENPTEQPFSSTYLGEFVEGHEQ